MRLVLATANPDKAAEMAAALASVPGLELLPRPTDVADVEESGVTLEDNALLKARALSRATAEAALADDTGLEIDALDGAPGVRSARFAGESATYDENVTAVLAALAAVPPPRRRARFRTVVAAVFPGGREVMAEGVVEGLITEERRGSAGFGYDPVFVPHGGDGRTFGEMTAAEKQALSHRARALAALVPLL